MNENKKEIISKNTSLAPLSTGLASRGLQVARQLAQQSHRIITNSIGMKLVLIPKGTFIMHRRDRKCEYRHHEITVSRDYYLGVTQVTQVQYEVIMGANPSHFQGELVNGDSSTHPVENVSWDEAVEFCELLSEIPEEKKFGRIYRLPTEAEWEYACRAGTKTDPEFSFMDKPELLGEYAWFEGNSGDQTHPVGGKKPNAWGLYDMHGNVWEWCNDWYCDELYDEYCEGLVIDPVGPKGGLERVVRGASCFDSDDVCDPHIRTSCHPSGGMYLGGQGFRVALSPSGMPQSPEADK
jgi:formylglycine-generating enzyme required for sulfatase activity